ncbi:MAG: NAD(P)H-dependent oxidoreductase [Firmicutes bacterium]|nr:NAD(P)H-dependent oxidoreductase [Bacillota bacterium]
MPHLLIVIASTRPGRVGLPVGQWFERLSREHGGFDIEVADLKELNLPMMDEPHHPRFAQYTQPHTKAWSRMVDASDAVVLVMPEYNHGITAPLKNALDYLYQEWNYKPVGLVSYGGPSGGMRAAQMVKQVATALKMMPLPDSVAIPFVTQYLRDGVFDPPDAIVQAAHAMLDELQRWTEALEPLRRAHRQARVGS